METSAPSNLETQFEARRLGKLLEAIEFLADDRDGGCHVSLYAPAGRLPDDATQGRIHFSNAISEARRALAEADRDEAAAERFLARPQALLDDEEFWNHQHGGVACFVTEDACSILSVGVELPCRGIVSSTFWIRPLLAAAANADAFYLLALSQKSVRLLRGSELGIRLVACPGLPQSYGAAMEELGYPADSATMAAAESHLKVNDDQLKKFFREIDAAVTAHIGSGGLPLLLACTDAYAPLYRAVNSYQDLSEVAISGNPDVADLESLRKRCVQALEPVAREGVARQLERSADPNEATAIGLEAVLAAAFEGRISTLVLPSDAESWGTFDPAEAHLREGEEPSMSSTDLFELAARQALNTGAEVFFTEASTLPEDCKPVAILRWDQESNRTRTQAPR